MPIPRFIRPVVVRSVVSVLGACASVALLGQTPTPAPVPQQPPVFRSGVDIVQVDVAVFDKNRQPIRGLKAQDFTILEDTKPQTIAAFSEVDVPDAPAVPVVDGRPITWMRDVAPDVQTNEPGEGRMFILLIDDALIPADPKIAANTKAIGQRIVDRSGPTDRMSVVFSENGRNGQDFTSDKSRLHAAVDKFTPGRAQWTFGWDLIRSRNSIGPLDDDRKRNPHPPSDPDTNARDSAFRTLQMVSDALIAAPQRRKTLIYVSPGIPVNHGMVTTLGLQSGRSVGPREDNVRLSDQMPDLFRLMQRANVVVYSIDPSGPGGIGDYVARTMAAIGVLHEYSPFPSQPETQEPPTIPCDNHPPPGLALPPCFVPEATDFGHLIANLNLDFMLEAASNTGGVAVTNTNDFEAGVSQLFVENSSYYLLGYRAPPGDKPGDLHRLKVTVNRPGAIVRTRSGYYTPLAEKPDKNGKKPALSPMAKAVASPLPASDLPLRVAVAPFAVPGKAESAVTIVLGLDRPSPQQPVADTVHVETRAFTPDGTPRGVKAQDAYVAIRPGTVAEIIHYEALSRIDLKPGRYELRIAAYSSLSDATGSVFANVEIPDFARDPLSLSGVVLTASPGLPAQPADAFAMVVPVLPTAVRAFSKVTRVTAFVRVYEGGKTPLTPARVVMRVTSTQGDTLVARTIALGADRFSAATRATDVREELPFVTLPRGEYLLSFEASVDGASTRRDVRFTVK